MKALEDAPKAGILAARRAKAEAARARAEEAVREAERHADIAAELEKDVTETEAKLNAKAKGT